MPDKPLSKVFQLKWDASQQITYPTATLTPRLTEADGTDRGGLWSSDPLDGFEVTACLYTGETALSLWRYGYRPFSLVTIETVGIMSTTLNRISRRLSQLEHQVGRPADFAAFALRIGRSLGISHFVVLGPDDFYEGRFTLYSLDKLGARLAPWVYDWSQSHA